jgi:putative membrane protein
MNQHLTALVLVVMSTAAAVPILLPQPAEGVDAAFVKDAAADGQAEVALGRLAAAKAQRADIKEFANRMIRDHGRGYGELQALAAANRLGLPTEMSPEHQSTHERLSNLSGSAFETAYLEAMRDAHQEAIAFFTTEARSGGTPEIRAWAGKTLPTLRAHLEHVGQLQSAGERSN